MNKQKLHILILEDNPEDAELMVNELRKNDFNFDWELVENKKEFVEAIEKKPDIILADYKLPTFDGLSAIKIQQKTAPDIPIIIVSGSIGEELAVECLKAGATGYVLKEKLSRLSLVIERSLKEAAERREFKKANEALKESEKKYHAIFEATGTATLIVEENTKIINANKECEDVTGYAVTELIGKSWTKFVYKDDLQIMMSRHTTRRKDPKSVPDKYEVRLIDAKGNIRNTILSIGMVPNSRRSTVSLVDITELKHADDLLKERIKELQCLYSITEIFGSEHIALEKLFQKAVNLLSQACQFPEITCARITFDGNVYKTKNFKKTKWILSKNIYIKDEVVGKIDVCYLKEKPGEYDELFCKKERKLLKEVVKKIEGYIEHVRAEEKIKKSEEKYRDMTELLPEIIYECDAYGNITFVNKAGFEKFGYTQDDFNKGVNAMQFITPAERERAGENVKEVLNGTEKGKFEYTALRKDNSEFPAVSYSSPIISNNKVVGLRGIVVDVTESKLVEDALRESDDKYHLLVENAPNVLWKTNEKGHTVFISSNIKEVFGFTPEDIYTDSDKWFERIHHDDLHKVETKFHELFVKNKKFNVEYRIKSKDGKWIWLNDISSVVHEEKGERYAYGVFTEITERKQAQETLKENEERYREIFKFSPDSIIIHDLDMNILNVNDTAVKEFGYSKKELLEKKIFELHPETEQKHSTQVLDAMKKEEMLKVDTQFVRKDGSVFWAEATPCKYNLGNKQIIHVVIRDITEQKQAEDALRESEVRYRALFETAGDAIFVMKANKFNNCNDATIQMFGCVDKNDIIEHSPWEFSPKIQPDGQDSKQKSMIYINSAIDGNPQQFYWQHKKKDGTLFEAEVSLNKLTIKSGNYIQAIVRDVTERKKAEEALMQSEKRFKRLFDGLGDAVFVTKIWGENKGNILEVNLEAIKQTGYTRDELLQMNIIKDLFVSGSSEINADDWEVRLLNGETVTTIEKKRKKDGTEYWTEMIVSQIDFDGEKYSLSINHDITNRKRAEQIQKVLYNISNSVITTDNLEKLLIFIKEQLSLIIDTTNFYIALYDSKTDTLSLPFISDEKDEFTSFPAGKTLTNYVIKTQKSLLATKEEIDILEQSGDVESIGTNSEIWLGVPLIVDGKVTGVIAVQSYKDENAYSKNDVEILEFVSHQISISIERKKTEQVLKDAFIKATESDRLKTTFLNTMSHELRTPLNAINGFSDIISEDLPINEILDYNKIINDSGSHLLNIIDDIFDISLIESGELKINKEHYNITEIIDEVSKIIINEQTRFNKTNVSINYKFKDKDFEIYTDKQKLKQILINLLKNSIKFTHEGFIECGYVKEIIDNQPMFKFWVKDTGIGIPIEKQKIIFDIFRQVDDSHTRKYDGTGIGLAVSKSLTELLGGKMWVESDKGKGSIFYFTLPENKAEIHQKSISSNIPKIENKFSGKTVLVAEDDLASYSLVKVLLKRLDIKTIHANNGIEAIELSEKHPETSMILMDVKMPDMNGYEATKIIKKISPELVVVAQTAYAMQGDNEKAIEAGCDDYIAKPIKKQKLFELMKKYLS